MKNYLERIYRFSKHSFCEIIAKKIKNNEKCFIVTVNPETIIEALKNNKLNKILLSDDTIMVPDAIGIIKAGKILKIKFKERIPGIELVEELFKKCNDLNKTLYVYGSKQENLNKLLINMKNNYQNIKIVGLKNGYTSNKSLVIEEIKKLKPDVIIIGLGIPKQEIFIDEIFNECEKGIFIGVGGSLDVLSGYKKRAPKMFIKLNLEWLYRIVKEPYRLKRFYQNNIVFFFKIIKIKILK